MNKALALALAGALVSAAVQPMTPAGWWLDSGRGVATVIGVLIALAALVGVSSPAGPDGPRSVAPAVAVWAGANIGMAVVLFWKGPGNLFPIVLAMGAGISAIAVAAGFLASAFLARLRRHP